MEVRPRLASCPAASVGCGAAPHLWRGAGGACSLLGYWGKAPRSCVRDGSPQGRDSLLALFTTARSASGRNAQTQKAVIEFFLPAQLQENIQKFKDAIVTHKPLQEALTSSLSGFNHQSIVQYTLRLSRHLIRKIWRSLFAIASKQQPKSGQSPKRHHLAFLKSRL